MTLVKLPNDIWRVIGTYLTKSDLIALQFTHPQLLKRLDAIPDIWWGKHNSHYQKSWDNFYNGVPKTRQDKIIEKLSREYNKSVIKKSQRKCKCRYGPGSDTIKGLFCERRDNIGRCTLRERMRGRCEDVLIIHRSGFCFECDYGRY